MSSYQISVDVILSTETCPACGTTFAMDKALQDSRRSDGNTFYCPNGHGQHYGTSTAAKLAEAEKALKLARQDAAYWRDEAETQAATVSETKRQLKTTRAELTRTKKRVGGGACPCCNRQFENLARHMSTQHPDYKAA